MDLRMRNDPEYLNWLAFGSAFKLLCDGLRKYAEDKMKELHALITTNVGGPGIQCTCKGTRRKYHNPHIGKTTCVWAQELKAFHINPDNIPWHQSTSSRWHDPALGYWEIAKLFMSNLGTNSGKIMDPSTTDGGHLLNLLMFCKYFNIQPATVKAVKFRRNEWAHKWDLKLSDIDKRTAFNKMENLINDPELVHDKDVQACHPAIKRVGRADFSILEKDELKILQEFRSIKEYQEHTMKDAKKDAKKKFVDDVDKLNFVSRAVIVVVLAVFLLAMFPELYKVPGFLVIFLFGAERNVISDDGKIDSDVQKHVLES